MQPDEAEPPEASDAMFDLPPGFWDEPMTEPPGEPLRPAQPARRVPPAASAGSAPVTIASGAPVDAAADSPLALVQQLFPGRVVSIEKPGEANEAHPVADEPAFADDELPPDD